MSRFLKPDCSWPAPWIRLPFVGSCLAGPKPNSFTSCDAVCTPWRRPSRKSNPTRSWWPIASFPAPNVSLQSALAHYGLIPEGVPVTTSVTTVRPGRWQTPLGVYTYRHVLPKLLSSYRQIDLGDDQKAFLATPEKALLDLVYLQPGGDAPIYLQELRLQNLEILDLEILQSLAERTGSPKMRRAAAYLLKLAQAESLDYEQL
jgi:hypothetical protein